MEFINKLTFDMIDFFRFLKRPFRAKLIPAEIWKDLDDLKHSPTQLKRYFQKFKMNIRFFKSLEGISNGYVHVNGDAYRDPMYVDIKIFTHDWATIKWTTYWWRRFKVLLIQTVLHELIHMMQFINGHEVVMARYKKTGSIKKDEELEYFSSSDEIQSYTHDIFLDYKMFRPNVSVSKLLKRYKTKRDSRTFNDIAEAFAWNTRDHNAFKKYVLGVEKWNRKYSKKLG
jgi:hypothetical protein